MYSLNKIAKSKNEYTSQQQEDEKNKRSNNMESNKFQENNVE